MQVLGSTSVFFWHNTLIFQEPLFYIRVWLLAFSKFWEKMVLIFARKMRTIVLVTSRNYGYLVLISASGSDQMSTTLCHLLYCQNHKNGQNSKVKTRPNRKSSRDSRSGQVFAVAQTRRKPQKQSTFFKWPIIKINLWTIH